MENDTIIKCGCCGEDSPASQATHDAETEDLVCASCRKELRNAKAILAMPFSAPHGGLPAMPIKIQGCYRGSDAPDNL